MVHFSRLSPVLLLSFAGAAILGAGPPVRAQGTSAPRPGYRFELLDFPSGGGNRPFALGPRGQIVGDLYAPTSPDSKPWVVLSDGRRQRIGVLDGLNGVARGVNASDVVVGMTYQPWQAFRWEAGAFTTLPSIHGEYSEAYDINDAGVIAGYSWGQGTYSLATLWYPDGSAHALTERPSVAFAISRHGSVTGQLYLDGGAARSAFLYESGTLHELPGWMGEPDARGIDLNDQNVVVGYTSPTLSGPRRAVAWFSGELREIRVAPPGVQAVCRRVNNRNQIVGWWGVPGATRLFLWQAGESYTLGQLAEIPDGWDFDYVSDIDDAGRIVVRGTLNGVFLGALLTPCVANLNRDPVIDAEDRVIFGRAYSTGDPLADIDGDGDVDPDDLAAFLAAYASGC